MARRILSSRETPRQPDVFNVFAAREAYSVLASDARQGAWKTHHRCHAKPELSRGAKRSAGWIEVSISAWRRALVVDRRRAHADGLANRARSRERSVADRSG